MKPLVLLAGVVAAPPAQGPERGALATSAARTAVGVARGRRRIERFDTWRGADLMESARRIAKLAGETSLAEWKARRREGDPPRPHIVVDEIGLGAGVLDRLRELGWPARGFNASWRARNPAKFTNARSEAFWSLREALSRGDSRCRRTPSCVRS